MGDTCSEILQFVKENDVKFVRLAFCDMFGQQKNIAIMADELPRAFSEGICFDSSAVAGFGDAKAADLFLVPDASSIAILPWRPMHERVMRMFCTVRNPDGSDCPADSRNILKTAVQRAADMGFMCRMGTECEFYLFQTDVNGNPTFSPYDQGSYADIAPLDRGENIRRDICLTLEEMGIRPESSHHENGPGQNEVDFRYSDALTAADSFLTFKSVVKSVSAQNGVFASFLPKPLPQKSGNGMHINISLIRGGKNLFETQPRHSADAESFIQGILERTAEITAFLNPLVNSYRRLGSFEAPKYITWSHQNRSQLIRIPASPNGEKNRMELRSPDPACNPYLVFALLIHAGLDGIEQKKKLTAPCDLNLFESEDYIRDNAIKALPQSLGEALSLAKESKFIKQVLDEPLFDRYIAQKQSQWDAYCKAQDQLQFEMDAYFLSV